jgi:hypothetical protein
MAAQSKDKIQDPFKSAGRIVFTKILPASKFYRAKVISKRWMELGLAIRDE